MSKYVNPPFIFRIFSILAHISCPWWAKDIKPVSFDGSNYFLSTDPKKIDLAYQELEIWSKMIKTKGDSHIWTYLRFLRSYRNRSDSFGKEIMRPIKWNRFEVFSSTGTGDMSKNRKVWEKIPRNCRFLIKIEFHARHPHDARLCFSASDASVPD